MNIKTIVIAGVFGGCALQHTVEAKSLKGTKPNIIILYADDMGVGDVSYGDPNAKIQTPNLDRLAAQGMTFNDGHSSSGVCTPSRYAILTGQHHWRRFHGIAKAYESSMFQPGEFTLPRMFNERGYTTACFGKWHLGWDWESIRKPSAKKGSVQADAYDWSKPFRGGPVDQGFEYYFGDGTINFPPYCWIENDRFVTIPTKPVIKSKPLAGAGGFRRGPMAPDWDPYKVLPTITDKTVEWIKEHDQKQPFFIYLAFNSPHAPIVPNKEFHKRSKAGYYGDFVVETDAMVGKVLEALQEQGLDENTMVIFSADNGAEYYAYDRFESTGHWSSGQFRGVKRDLYEGGHRVPFIVRWPGQIREGSVSNEVVNQVDLAATFAEIIGYDLKNNEAIDSYNLLQVLKSEPHAKPLRTATVQNTYKSKFSLRQEEWVYINTAKGTTNKKESNYFLTHFKLEAVNKKDGGAMLFNLNDDPRQSQNLYGKYPEKVKQMSELLKRYVDGERCAPLR